jgi:hypothetical protein
MIAEKKIVTVSEEERNIIRVLLYFDIFQYPITLDEIERFMPLPPLRVAESTSLLLDANMIYKLNNYYGVQNNLALATRRDAGNQLAEKKLKTANRFSKIVAAIPFVRAVMLSGSISKGYMDAKSDIDYFIITSPGRLWFVRSALALFRRVFLLNSHKNLCTNYFIDTNGLEIPEKNLFSAIELTTLRPTYGHHWVREFHQANSWVFDFLPNQKLPSPIDANPSHLLKPVMEKIFSLKVLDRLERTIMTASINRWKKKYASEMDEKDFEIAFRSTPSVSRAHPQFFQKKVLSLYHQKIKSFEDQYGITL